MTCGHCKQTVEEVSGMADVTVYRESEQTSVDGEANVTALVEAVQDAGYTAHARV